MSVLCSGLSRLGSLDSVFLDSHPAEAGVVAMYARGDLASLADAFGDIPQVNTVKVRSDQIELTAHGCQEILPRLIELATLCDVQVLAVAVQDTGGHLPRPGSGPLSLLDPPLAGRGLPE